MTPHLRDLVGRALYEEPGTDCDWSKLPDERREPWRKDADRVIPIIAADYAAVMAEKRRAQEACELMGATISELLDALQAFPNALDAGRPPYLEDYDNARNLIHKARQARAALAAA